MPKYKIPVSWSMCDELIIEADSLEDAIDVAEESNLTAGSYIDGSFEVNHDILENCNDVYVDKIIVKCIVSAEDSSGFPTLYYIKIDCTKGQYEGGEHYAAAVLSAEEDGYKPYLAYDENDTAGRAMLVLADWDEVKVVSI